MKKFFCVFLLALISVLASAVPARQGITKTLLLTDGTTVTAQLVGDEYGHYWLAADGKAYLLIEGTDRYQEVDTEGLMLQADERRSEADSRRMRRLAPQRRVGEVGNYTGQKKGLIILVNYTDVTFKAGDDNALYQRIANEENFSYGSFKGSLHDYFFAQSEGQFDLTFDVVGPVTVSRNRAYYGANRNGSHDSYPATMVIEAVKLADASVNYADYDWDGNGEVDQVFVVFAGKGEANGGTEDTIWPHEWTLSSASANGDGQGRQRLDGVYINTYACGAELGSGGNIDGIGTMCHEFSHCLGYPDFYDTDYSGGQGMGYWDLMSSGSYNGNSFQPAGYTSYERWVAGWKEPTELTADTTVTDMKALQQEGESFVIYNPGNRNEYFLLESRQKTGWDASLPGWGLLILHVDYNASIWSKNKANDDPAHQRMTWIPADNEYQYQMSGQRRSYTKAGMANDPYPYGAVNSFSKSSTPAAQFYNKNKHGNYDLESAVTNITQNSDGTISFRFVANNGSETAGTNRYRIVTSTSQLTDGARCIIASGARGKAAGALNSTYLRSVDVEVADNMITANDDVLVLTVIKQGSNYAFQNQDGQYLSVGGLLQPQLSFSSSAATFSLSSGNNGLVMGYQLWLAGSGKLQYNSNNSRFEATSSSRVEANLYVEVLPYEMTLADGADNASEIAAHKGEICNVTLSGRTLYKDGAWNTLCLPFDLTVAGSVLDGADVRELTTASFDKTTGVLTLRFTPVTAIEAGQPYVVKWTEGDNIKNPTFKGVTIVSEVPRTATFDDGQVLFKGIFSPTDIYSADRSNLYIGSSNKLIHAASDKVSSFLLNAFRAYFHVSEESSLRSVALDFAEEETTDIATVRTNSEPQSDGAFYTLSGQRVTLPVKGLYIRNGKKIIVK